MAPKKGYVIANLAVVASVAPGAGTSTTYQVMHSIDYGATWHPEAGMDCSIANTDKEAADTTGMNLDKGEMVGVRAVTTSAVSSLWTASFEVSFP
jgi:hypothetical protein